MNRLSFEKIFYHLGHLCHYIKQGDCYPVHMTVGLTNRCNHACIWCYGHDTISEHYNDNDFAPLNMILDTIQEATQVGLRSVTLVGTGEPTLHPRFVEIVRGIKSTGVDIGLFTNGSLLDKQKIDDIIDTHTFIRLSCSAADRDEHDRIHHAGRAGNDFDRIVNNIKSLLLKRGEKPFPTIGVQFLVSHHNWHSLLPACRLWKDLGVDYYALKPVYKNPNITEHEENEIPLKKAFALMRETEKLEDETFKVYAKYEQFNRLLNAKDHNRSYDKCHGQAFETFFDPDGKFYICGNMHGKEEFSIGNVMERGSFKAVWNGQRRKQVLRNLNVNNCPPECRMDPLNRIVEDLNNPDPEIHPNFL